MTTQHALSTVSRFNSLPTARAYADRCIKIHLILLGDDGRFWVGLPRVTEALHRQGYEYA